MPVGESLFVHEDCKIMEGCCSAQARRSSFVLRRKGPPSPAYFFGETPEKRLLSCPHMLFLSSLPKTSVFYGETLVKDLTIIFLFFKIGN
ncbi:MAG TPA: hypothetical protein IAD07_09950 [Candidatus Fimivicinus intestinavium]|nr:hypothetical protein [Candidatus Fimivicinus intestinavium]